MNGSALSGFLICKSTVFKIQNIANIKIDANEQGIESQQKKGGSAKYLLAHLAHMSAVRHIQF